MEIWEYEFMEWMLENKRRRDSLVKELSVLPEGNLIRHRRGVGKWDYYIYSKKDGIRKAVYVSRKNQNGIVNQMKAIKSKRNKIKEEIAFLKRITERNRFIAMKIIEAFSPVDEGYAPVPSEKDDPYGNLKFLTTRGEFLRSKSERLIADALYRYNINYFYEKKLALKSFNVHPDFTIVSPLNGEVYYWEHLGMDDPNYIVDWINRKAEYKEIGIVEGENLIVTTEKDTNRFDTIVAGCFTIHRYDKVLEK